MRIPSVRPSYDAASARLQLGDLTTGRAFDNNCVCHGETGEVSVGEE